WKDQNDPPAQSRSAFAWRNAKFWILMRTVSNSSEKTQKQAKGVVYLNQQFLDHGLRNPETEVGMVYVNFKDPMLSKEEYPLAYWGHNARRLSEIKTKYDPNNLFKFAQSIPLS